MNDYRDVEERLLDGLPEGGHDVRAARILLGRVSARMAANTHRRDGI